MEGLNRHRLAATAASILLLMGLGSMAVAAEEELSLPTRPGAPIRLRLAEHMSVEDGRPEQVLQIYVASSDPCCPSQTAVAGRYDRVGNTVAFRPAFPLVPGLDYVAVVREGARRVPFRLAPPAARPDPVVTEVFPSGDVLPENLLRLYIHFSVPMAAHRAFDHIELRDDAGVVDDAAFMRFKQELWNEDRTRLTVLIDPGRIKRGVATNMDLGPALHEGGVYRLHVTGGWPSADGSSTLAAFSKPFRVSAPLRHRPGVQQWRMSPPCIGTRDPLVAHLDRPFDRHLVSAAVRVTTADHQPVPGRLVVSEGETEMRFTPDEAWVSHDLLIEVDALLEDVAGNHFGSLLDDVTGGAADAPADTVLPVRLLDCSTR